VLYTCTPCHTQARCDKPDPALAEACTQMASFALSGAAKPAQSLTKYLQENCKMQPPSKASACACAAGSDAPECVNAGWFACINGNSLCHGMMLGQKAPPEAITRLAKYIGDKCSQDLGVNNVDMNFTGECSATLCSKAVPPGLPCQGPNTCMSAYRCTLAVLVAPVLVECCRMAFAHDCNPSKYQPCSARSASMHAPGIA
jgi:hypothetical protein